MRLSSTSVIRNTTSSLEAWYRRHSRARAYTCVVTLYTLRCVRCLILFGSSCAPMLLNQLRIIAPLVSLKRAPALSPVHSQCFCSSCSERTLYSQSTRLSPCPWVVWLSSTVRGIQYRRNVLRKKNKREVMNDCSNADTRRSVLEVVQLLGPHACVYQVRQVRCAVHTPVACNESEKKALIP